MQSNNSYWSRFPRTRLSRRSFVRGAALAGGGLAGAALIGCGGDDDDDEAPAPRHHRAVWRGDIRPGRRRGD